MNRIAIYAALLIVSASSLNASAQSALGELKKQQPDFAPAVPAAPAAKVRSLQDDGQELNKALAAKIGPASPHFVDPEHLISYPFQFRDPGYGITVECDAVLKGADGGTFELARSEFVLKKAVTHFGEGEPMFPNVVVEETWIIRIARDGHLLDAKYKMRSMDGDYYPDCENHVAYCDTVVPLQTIGQSSAEFKAGWAQLMKLWAPSKP